MVEAMTGAGHAQRERPQWIVPLRVPHMLLLLIGLCLALPVVAQKDTHQDMLDLPAQASAWAVDSLLLDVVNTGTRLVAVGERGHILYSDDGGEQWLQARVPAQVTLTAVYFVSPRKGWVVGHDGIVLHSEDGGETWHKQLDGFQANRLMLDHYQARYKTARQRLRQAVGQERAALETTLDNLEMAMGDAQIAVEEGPTKPFLDLWFRNEREGLVVGAYGMIFRTDDGGAHWTPWMAALDNPMGYHYNSIAQVQGDVLLMAGEAGTLYRSRDGGQRWETLNAPYDGSLFGLVTVPGRQQVVLFGLRGNAYLSRDLGNSWQALDTGTDATLMGGTGRPDGSLVIVGNSGTLLQGRGHGRHFSVNVRPDRLAYSAVAAVMPNRLVLVGRGGVQLVSGEDFGKDVARVEMKAGERAN